jgi:hypothetical protein
MPNLRPIRTPEPSPQTMPLPNQQELHPEPASLSKDAKLVEPDWAAIADAATD